MESLEQLLAEMATGQEAGRDLEFQVDPARVRQTLATLVKADRILWLKHLLQWLYDVALEEPPVLARWGKDRLRLHLRLSDAELSSRLTPSRLREQEGRLLGQASESKLARILCEIEGTVAYAHCAEPEQALLISPVSFQLGPSMEGAPERGLCLDIPVEAVVRTSLLFGFNGPNTRRVLQPLAGMHPSPPRMERMDPLIPDWPFVTPSSDMDEDVPGLWDWESVDPGPASGPGFAWTVPAWGEALRLYEETEPQLSVFHHPMEIRRSASTLPIMGCYPPALANRISAEPARDQPLLAVRCRRVFGISWTASAPKKAELFPILRGVPGTSIALDGAPAGLYLMADASHLRTDASGLSLVRDHAMESWLVEQVDWARIQTSLYIPFIGAIPRLWMARIKRWEDAGRPPTTWRRIWQSAVTGIFSAAPVQGLIDRRAEALFAWASHRE